MIVELSKSFLETGLIVPPGRQRVGGMRLVSARPSGGKARRQRAPSQVVITCASSATEKTADPTRCTVKDLTLTQPESWQPSAKSSMQKRRR